MKNEGSATVCIHQLKYSRMKWQSQTEINNYAEEFSIH